MPMQRILVIVVVGACCVISDASWPKIAGYNAMSKITSHAAIDLDQMALENALGLPTITYRLVRSIYEQGGNSKPYAEFAIPPLENELHKGDRVLGTQSGASGTIYKNYLPGAIRIKIAYATSESQESYVDCKGGALLPAPSHEVPSAMKPYILTKKCFQKEDLTVNTMIHGVEAEVTIETLGAPANKAGRTLQDFSTSAGGTMYLTGPNGGCVGSADRATDGCPYLDFAQYFNYYGSYDYANKLILAAIDAKYTSFGKVNSPGHMDFTGKDDKIRKEIIQKSTAHMSLYMYAIREFEDAIDDCIAGCPSSDSASTPCNTLSADVVHAWDEGVAYYTGSLEGATKGGSGDGRLSYRLAENLCKLFKSCGSKMDKDSGASFVNIEMFRLLEVGKNRLLEGKCEATRPTVREIVALMSVPLIQSTLYYAYQVGNLNGDDKHKALGAVFAAAIVPRVASCSSEDANTIMNNMNIGASSTSFASVKAAFENNYECMNITCAHVGGLWFPSNKAYYEDAAPCGVPKAEDVSSASVAAPSLVLITAAARLLL